VRVRVHPSDEGGTGFYRMREPARVVRELGHSVEARKDVPTKDKVERGRVVAMRAIVDDLDVCVFQRTVNPDVVALIPSIQAQGVAVVVDMDDDEWALPSQYRGLGERYIDGRLSLDPNTPQARRNMAKGCALADLVTVTSEALAARYGAHGRVAILPNTVPARILDLPRFSDGRTVGWFGTQASHLGDLEVTHGGVGEALDRCDARFLHTGEPGNVAEKLGIPAERFHSQGRCRLDEYYRRLGALDVGIAPLADTKFNAAKSYLKPMEYMARGVAWVGSPRAEYARIAQTGVGLLADDRRRNWRQAVTRLLTDDEYRRQHSERGMEIVREHFTTEGNAELWLDAWQLAIDIRRQSGRSRPPLAA
jgi:glycosyltransferase involved in cell wall biosynthesis